MYQDGKIHSAYWVKLTTMLDNAKSTIIAWIDTQSKSQDIALQNAIQQLFSNTNWFFCHYQKDIFSKF